MLLAHLPSKQPIHASLAHRSDAPFLCPECSDEVSLRKGTVSIPHFSHKPKSRCSFGEGETDSHRACKLEIWNALQRHPDVTDLHLEYRLGDVRPDVFAVIKGTPVAIEIQLSNLPPEVITKRTAAYRRHGIYVLWLLEWSPKLNRREYSPRRFERWLHATYFGRVYFWSQGLTVLPYRFDTLQIDIDRQKFQNAKGKTVVIRAHKRISRRFKRAIRGRELHLVHDFHGVQRDTWTSKNLHIPEACIYIDKHKDPFKQQNDFKL